MCWELNKSSMSKVEVKSQQRWRNEKQWTLWRGGNRDGVTGEVTSEAGFMAE